MRFRVPFCDVDMLQHVNNVAYVTWAETVRCNYFDEVFGTFRNKTCGIILAKTELEYLHPLDYREAVAVACRVSRVGRKSFDMVYEVWSENRQSMAAHGRTVMVAYNYEKQASTAVPEEWKKAIADYEVVAPVGK
jgi:acyl-CoA thioester hydrolase